MNPEGLSEAKLMIRIIIIPIHEIDDSDFYIRFIAISSVLNESEQHFCEQPALLLLP